MLLEGPFVAVRLDDERATLFVHLWLDEYLRSARLPWPQPIHRRIVNVLVCHQEAIVIFIGLFLVQQD